LRSGQGKENFEKKERGKENLKEKEKEKEETEKKNQPKEVFQCGICFENIEIQGILDVCKHTFCFDCIHRWSKTANTCPMCKARFRTITKDSEQISSKRNKKSTVKIPRRDANFHDPNDDYQYVRDHYGDEHYYVGFEFMSHIFQPFLRNFQISIHDLEDFEDVRDFDSDFWDDSEDQDQFDETQPSFTLEEIQSQPNRIVIDLTTNSSPNFTHFSSRRNSSRIRSSNSFPSSSTNRRSTRSETRNSTQTSTLTSHSRGIRTHRTTTTSHSSNPGMGSITTTTTISSYSTNN